MRPGAWVRGLIWTAVALIASWALSVARVPGIDVRAASNATGLPVVERNGDEGPRTTSLLTELPLRFEANMGQTDERVSFLTRGRGYTLFLTSNEAVFALQTAGSSDTVRMMLLGANPAPRVSGRGRLSSKTHYYLGSDPSDWRLDVPSYAEVTFEDVYPGIDLVYHSRTG